MTHSQTLESNGGLRYIPSRRLLTLSPLANQSVRELFKFWALDSIQATMSEFPRDADILELIRIWLFEGSALDLLDTYEKYVATVFEMVGNVNLQQSLCVEIEEVRSSSDMAALLGLTLSQKSILHPALRWETYTRAQRQRKLIQ